MNHASTLLAAGAIAIASTLIAAPCAAQQPDIATDVFATDVQPLLQRYCYRCHGPDKQKGDVQLDLLGPELRKRPDAKVGEPRST